jgi:dTDP-4-dehydrorhamnose 3,5-epimerase
MKTIPLEIPELILFEFDVYDDDRGHFFESWRQSWFSEFADNIEFVQDNQSKSKKGTLRGLHYQIENPQGKFIRVIKGRIFDVAVDLRKKSPTFGQAVSIELDEQTRNGLWIPEGFAHGFCAISEDVEIIYKCTNYYSAKDERTLLWNDPALGIDWPFADTKLTISSKDREGVTLNESDVYE